MANIIYLLLTTTLILGSAPSATAISGQGQSPWFELNALSAGTAPLYRPYCETKTEEGSLAVSRKFTGKELDEETGLYDYSARHYDPKLGRFITADPVDPSLENPQTLNRYSYCLNNPLKFIDPSGHAAFLAAALAIPGAREAIIIIGGYLVLKWSFERLSRSVHSSPFIRLNFHLPGFSRSAKPPPAVESPSIAGLKYAPEGISYAEAPSKGVMRAEKTYRHYGYEGDADSFKDGLKPGSYATEAKGRPMKGKTAQQKLSLPHEDPPDAYYKVKPKPGTIIKGPHDVKSTNVPSRTGGGQEYKFPKGTGKGTVTGSYKLD